MIAAAGLYELAAVLILETVLGCCLRTWEWGGLGAWIVCGGRLLEFD